MPVVELGAVLIAFLGNLFLALFTYQKNPKSATNRLFLLFALTIGGYLISNYMSLHQPTDHETLIWVKLIMLAAVLINLLFFLLTSVFPDSKFNLNSKLIWAATLFSVILIPLTQTELIFKSVKYVGQNISSEPGPAMPVFLLHTVLLLGGGFFRLLKKYRDAQGLAKSQIKLFLMGTVFMFLAIIVSNLLLVLIFNTSAFIWLLPFYTLIFVGSISYAIVKLRFLDISLLVARTVSFTLLVLIFAFIHGLTMANIANLLLDVPVTGRSVVVLGMMVMLMAVTFQPIKRLLEVITDKVFYKDRYHTDKLLYELAVVMASTYDLEALSHRILKILTTQMRIKGGALILTSKNKIYDVATEGEFSLPKLIEDDLEQLMNHRMVVLEDLSSEDKRREILAKMGAGVVVPLVSEGENIGLLLFNVKLSGDLFSDGDVRVFEILAPEVSVAVQNARSYEEIRRFNITLQEEVDKATKDLQLANAKLEELDKLKDDFVSIASHELRTPMTAIRSYAWMALHRSDVPLTEKLQKYLTRTLVSTERLINLVNDMLNISRIESGRVEITPKVFDIQALVDEVFTEVGEKAKEKNLHLENVKMQNVSALQVFADPDKVMQILLNLVGNAMKFTSAEGFIKVTYFSDGQMVDISVTDNGVGISKEDMARLFTKFGRLENSYVSAATTGGTGLGLYIVKSLVERMKGRIKAVSEGLGKGSTFTFSLPAPTSQVLADQQKYTNKVDGTPKLLEPVSI